MVTLDCPWCEAPVPYEPAPALRCETCSVEVVLAPDTADELALAA